jgi:hypothetical protein
VFEEKEKVDGEVKNNFLLFLAPVSSAVVGALPLLGLRPAAIEPPQIVLTKLKEATINNYSGSCVACWSEIRQGQHYFNR